MFIEVFSTVTRTGLEPANVLGESQATLPIRPPRQVRGNAVCQMSKDFG